METLERKEPEVLQNWRLLETPPLTGQENMKWDADLLDGVDKNIYPPTIRLFRFNRRTVTFGRVQRLEDVFLQVPIGWDIVQRPTGGGIVFHDNDLCFSLCWRMGQKPLPRRLRDLYAWIHGRVLEAFDPRFNLRLATCDDSACSEDFATRQCFSNPVAFDILRQGQKVVGGALSCRRDVWLYQGAIQTSGIPDFHLTLREHFANIFRL